MSSCFVIGKMSGLTYTQYQQYSNAASIFFRVQKYNANISTIRGNGGSGSYYQFVSNEEQTLFTLGQYVVNQNDPGNPTKYALVQQN